MSGFFAYLTPEQQQAALNYRGDETHGDDALKWGARHMKYKVYDNWSGKPVASGLSYLEAKKFVEQNEPPFNARVGARYGYWPENPQQTPGA